MFVSGGSQPGKVAGKGFFCFFWLLSGVQHQSVFERRTDIGIIAYRRQVQLSKFLQCFLDLLHVNASQLLVWDLGGGLPIQFLSL